MGPLAFACDCPRISRQAAPRTPAHASERTKRGLSSIGLLFESDWQAQPRFPGRSDVSLPDPVLRGPAQMRFWTRPVDPSPPLDRRLAAVADANLPFGAPDATFFSLGSWPARAKNGVEPSPQVRESIQGAKRSDPPPSRRPRPSPGRLLPGLRARARASCRRRRLGSQPPRWSRRNRDRGTRDRGRTAAALLRNRPGARAGRGGAGQP